MSYIVVAQISCWKRSLSAAEVNCKDGTEIGCKTVRWKDMMQKHLLNIQAGGGCWEDRQRWNRNRMQNREFHRYDVKFLSKIQAGGGRQDDRLRIVAVLDWAVLLNNDRGSDGRLDEEDQLDNGGYGWDVMYEILNGFELKFSRHEKERIVALSRRIFLDT